MMMPMFPFLLLLLFFVDSLLAFQTPVCSFPQRLTEAEFRCQEKPRCHCDRRTAISLPFLSYLLQTNGALAAQKDDKKDDVVAPITQKVLMSVRISRSDGTFYVRDDLDDTPENRVFYGQLVIGLFGTAAPTSVERFLSYVNVTSDPLDDNPLPTYARSNFVSLDQTTGLLMGGSIPALDAINFNGVTVLQYVDRILPASLWNDKSGERIPHDRAGLLTHRTLDLLPIFGILTRENPDLDGSHRVFGQLLLDDSSREFLRICKDIPTYSMENRKKGSDGDTAVDVVSRSVFNSQRELFRGAAKVLGDSRVRKVYEGKLLRRVEVTKIELI